MWHSGLALIEASAHVCPTAGTSLYLDIGVSPERATLVAPDTCMATSTCRVVAVLAPSRPILRTSKRIAPRQQRQLLMNHVSARPNLRDYYLARGVELLRVLR